LWGIGEAGFAEEKRLLKAQIRQRSTGENTMSYRKRHFPPKRKNQEKEQKTAKKAHEERLEGFGFGPNEGTKTKEGGRKTKSRRRRGFTPRPGGERERPPKKRAGKQRVKCRIERRKGLRKRGQGNCGDQTPQA